MVIKVAKNKKWRLQMNKKLRVWIAFMLLITATVLFHSGVFAQEARVIRHMGSARYLRRNFIFPSKALILLSDSLYTKLSLYDK